MEFDFGQIGGLFGAIAAIAALIQLGLIVLLVVVLFDLRTFLQEGSRLMRRTDRFLERREHMD